MLPQPHYLSLHIIQDMARIRPIAHLGHLSAQHENTARYFLLAACTRGGGFELRARRDDDLDKGRTLDRWAGAFRGRHDVARGERTRDGAWESLFDVFRGCV